MARMTRTTRASNTKNGIVTQTKLLLLILGWCYYCCLCPFHMVHASIQIPNDDDENNSHDHNNSNTTNLPKVYPSRPDRENGLQMRPGLVYPARLQHIVPNPYLCDDGKYYNITTIPRDGLPVALLVKKGYCSYEAKAEYASRNIHPQGVVKFLIIDGEPRLQDDYDDDGKDDGEEGHVDVYNDGKFYYSNDNVDGSPKTDPTSTTKTTMPFHDEPTTSTTPTAAASTTTSIISESSLMRSVYDYLIMSTTTTTTATATPYNENDESLLEASLSSSSSSSSTSPLIPFPKEDESATTLKKIHDNDVSVAILHVSYRTGYELLTTILNESVQVKMDGGTRINLDGNSPPADKFRLIMWLSLSVFLALSACCCLAASISNLLELQQPEQPPPTRPRRRRLTIKQVKELFPVGIFNGTELIFDNDVMLNKRLAPNESRNDNDNEVPDDAENALQPSPKTCFPPQPQSLEDACTICLDEYAVGEKVRCLPCGHCFHAKCIGRWLVERSATCPLCKIDLYEEEEQEEEEGSEGQQADIATRRAQLSQSHLPGLARVLMSTNDNDNNNNTNANAGGGGENRQNALFSSWASIPPEATTVPTTDDARATNGTEANEANGNNDREGTTRSSSWWRRARRFGRDLFTSGGIQASEEGGSNAEQQQAQQQEQSVVESLTEPLLQQQQQEEEDRDGQVSELRPDEDHSPPEQRTSIDYASPDDPAR